MIQKPKNLGEVMVVATRGLRLEQATAYAIAAHVMGESSAWVLAHPETKITEEQTRRICNMLTWVRMGRPLAQLTGERAFFGRSFTVNERVLVPRPETEGLIEAVIGWLRETPSTQPHIVDVGTGSGIIAVTLALELPSSLITASDISVEALQIAASNAEQHGVDVVFRQTDLLEGVAGPFDVIAANPPYIATPVLAGLPVRRWEPRIALDGGEDGLSLLRRLVTQAAARLNTPGLFITEIGYEQGEQVRALCEAAFPAAEVSVLQDLTGHDRFVRVIQG